MRSDTGKDVVLYAAGFFDGEGHVEKTRLTCQIGQNDRRPLEYLQTYFGGSIQKRRNRHNNGHHVLVLTAMDCREFYEAILPYSIVKAVEISEALERFATQGRYRVSHS